MLAKGRLLGVQFEAFLEDNLFLEIGKKEVAQAMRIRQVLLDKGIPLLMDSPTNQQFPILPNQVIDKLGEKYSYEFWSKVDEGRSAIRFCTSWSTRDEDLDALLADLKAL